MLEEELPTKIKTDITEYVNLLDKKNVVKNRKWAYQVIKNMILTSN